MTDFESFLKAQNKVTKNSKKNLIGIHFKTLLKEYFEFIAGEYGTNLIKHCSHPVAAARLYKE